MPCEVQRATALAAPYSRSSGWATTASMRCQPSSSNGSGASAGPPPGGSAPRVRAPSLEPIALPPCRRSWGSCRRSRHVSARVTGLPGRGRCARSPVRSQHGARQRRGLDHCARPAALGAGPSGGTRPGAPRLRRDLGWRGRSSRALRERRDAPLHDRAHRRRDRHRQHLGSRRPGHGGRPTDPRRGVRRPLLARCRRLAPAARRHAGPSLRAAPGSDVGLPRRDGRRPLRRAPPGDAPAAGPRRARSAACSS